MTEVVHSLLGELFHILDVTYTKNELALSLAIINLGNNIFASQPMYLSQLDAVALECLKSVSHRSSLLLDWRLLRCKWQSF